MTKTTVPRDREGELIHRLARIIPSAELRSHSRGLRIGIGDDATILRPIAGSEMAISCDSCLEGVHFHPKLQPPESVGYKSLARATSDLAAMGAIPSHFLLTLALPPEKTGKWLDRFAKGMAKAARRFRMILIGGDISSGASVLASVTVVGRLKSGKAVLRSGARPGDLIYVSGPLGRAQLGLEIVLRGLSGSASPRHLVQHHFYPEIQLELGIWLASHRVASAMMDLSDGLSMDLPRLCGASGVGARIFETKIPKIVIPRPLHMHKLDPLGLALHGGEDYELLFAVPPGKVRHLGRAPGAASLKMIGEITRTREIILVGSDGSAARLPSLGWDHFRGRK